jgi:hypothetical protein
MDTPKDIAAFAADPSDHVVGDAGECALSGPFPAVERREALRIGAVVRTVKVTARRGEFIAVMRDVSDSGIALKAFHDLPLDDDLALELENGEVYELDYVRGSARNPIFAFKTPLKHQDLLVPPSNFAKRHLRFRLVIPVTIVLGQAGQRREIEATAYKVSQQGIQFTCDEPLAIDQRLVISAPEMPELSGAVRWRSNSRHGAVLDTRFALEDFALKLAQIQCPALLR